MLKTLITTLFNPPNLFRVVLDYTKEIKKVVRCPLMVTGGFRTRAFIEEVVENGEVDLVGMARPLAINPHLCNQILRGENVENQVHPLSSFWTALLFARLMNFKILQIPNTHFLAID